MTQQQDQQPTSCSKKDGESQNPFERYYDSPMSEFPLLSRILFRFLIVVVWCFTKIYWHWTVDGRRPFGPKKEGQTGRVFISNHASMLDPAVFLIDAATHGSRLRALYKSELDNSAIASWLFSRVGAMPIVRESADTKALRRAVTCLKRGEDILIFPQGQRVRDPQARPEIYGGFAMIAQLAGADIIPAVIDGSERICPKGKGFYRPARIYMRYGEPLSIDQVSGANRRERSAALEKLAMDTVYHMREEVRREHGRADA